MHERWLFLDLVNCITTGVYLRITYVAMTLEATTDHFPMRYGCSIWNPSNSYACSFKCVI